MRVGKTEATLCDQCGKPLPQRHTVVVLEKKELHLCSGTQCLKERFLEDEMADLVDKARRAEIKLIWKLVCPADRRRLRDLL